MPKDKIEMPLEDNNAALATPAPPQDAPPPSTTDAGAAPGTPQPTPEEPFLKVSDRQVYKTREEAQRAYAEAGTRIAQLSPWEQLAKEGFTPQQVQSYLDDLARRIEAEKQAAATPPSSEDVLVAAIAGDKAAYAKLSPEQKQHADGWIAHQAYLEKLGYVRKDALNPLQQQVAQLSNATEQQKAAHFESARSNGESIFTSIVKENGLQLNDEQSKTIVNSIEDAINRVSLDAKGEIIPGSEADRFINGSHAEREAILRGHFDWFLKFGDLYSKRQTSQLIDQKAAAQAASPRPLPASSSPVPAPSTGGRGFKDPGLNSRVQQIMEQERARRGGGPLL